MEYFMMLHGNSTCDYCDSININHNIRDIIHPENIDKIWSVNILNQINMLYQDVSDISIVFSSKLTSLYIGIELKRWYPYDYPEEQYNRIVRIYGLKKLFHFKNSIFWNDNIAINYMKYIYAKHILRNFLYNHIKRVIYAPGKPLVNRMLSKYNK